jgi:hypothetical protein
MEDTVLAEASGHGAAARQPRGRSCRRGTRWMGHAREDAEAERGEKAAAAEAGQMGGGGVG